MNNTWGQLISFQQHVPTIPLTTEEICIGRKHQTSLQKIEKISSNHCTISYTDLPNIQIFTITDTSTNGTYLNGEKLERDQETTLSPYDEITLLNKKNQPEAISFMFLVNPKNTDDHDHNFHKSYELQELLGVGSFSIVRKAKELNDSTNWAVKIVSLEKAKKQNAVEQVQREYTLLKKLHHNNIVEFHDFFQTDGHMFVVMECIDGKSLETVLDEGISLSDQDIMSVIEQLVRVVVYLHENDVVHRDLKPDNIILTNDSPPQIKLMDFGLGRLVDEQQMANTICGTPLFASPELIKSKKI
ncbi:non-specific serine/threonine protein kinase [Entamoeba marina]